MGSEIKVIHSIIAPEALLEYLTFYDIGDVCQCRFLARGLNDSYFVETNRGKYIFRVYRSGWRSYSDILFELEAINHLHNKDVKVSIPINKRDGYLTNEIFAPEGTRYAVLFKFAEGGAPQIDESTSYSVGQTLGQIHSATNSFFPQHERSYNLDIKHLIDEPMKLITPLIKSVLGEAEVKFLQEFVINLKTKIPFEKLENGFCHGDYHDWNLHSNEGELMVFDFDCSGFGYRAYDIAIYWWNLKTNYPDREEECWSSFMRGYSKVRKLPELDLEMINSFIGIRRIWLLGVYIKNVDVWGTNWISNRGLSHFINCLKEDYLK